MSITPAEVKNKLISQAGKAMDAGLGKQTSYDGPMSAAYISIQQLLGSKPDAASNGGFREAVSCAIQDGVDKATVNEAVSEADAKAVAYTCSVPPGKFPAAAVTALEAVFKQANQEAKKIYADNGGAPGDVKTVRDAAKTATAMWIVGTAVTGVVAFLLLRKGGPLREAIDRGRHV